VRKKNLKKRAGGVAQGVGPKFKSQYSKKKKEKKVHYAHACKYKEIPLYN
jgi:hypothetical protein